MASEFMRVPYGSPMHEQITQRVEDAVTKKKAPIWFFNKRKMVIAKLFKVDDQFFSVQLDEIH